MEAIKTLGASIARQEQKLEKLEDVRINLAKLETEIVNLQSEFGPLRDKFDKVRTTVIAAGAIVSAAAIVIPLILRFLPGATPPQVVVVPQAPAVVAPVAPATAPPAKTPGG